VSPYRTDPYITLPEVRRYCRHTPNM